MATNYWGHVTLNHQLIDLVKAAGMAAAEGHHARVILVSSMAAMSGDLHSVSNGNFNLDDMRDGGLSLSMFRSLQYPNSKQAQLIYGKKLAKILSEERANVSVSVLHPGSYCTVHTDVVSFFFQPFSKKLFLCLPGLTGSYSHIRRV